jgi:hypothetical protein
MVAALADGLVRLVQKENWSELSGAVLFSYGRWVFPHDMFACLSVTRFYTGSDLHIALISMLVYCARCDSRANRAVGFVQVLAITVPMTNVRNGQHA